MYHILYSEDTPENRKDFLNNWINSYCQMQTDINFGISAYTIAKNFSRLYFRITEHDLILEFIARGYKSGIKDNAVYFNIAPNCQALRNFRIGWN